MKKFYIIGIVSLAVLILSTHMSYALVMTFDDLEKPGYGVDVLHNYSTGGFILTSNSLNGFTNHYHNSSYYYGSAALINECVGGLTTLSSTSNIPFTVNSMDLHKLYSGTVTVQFYAYDGNSNQLGYKYFSFDNNNWNTVNFDSSFQNIASLKWQQIYPYHSFDNLTLNSTQVVPEPTTMVLFGIGGIATALLRRKKKLS